MSENGFLILAGLGILFTGISKAGFGGGLGVLTTPLCALAFGPKTALGIVLPLLCAADFFSLYHYWGKWERRNLLYLIPGCVLGILLGIQGIGRLTARGMNQSIGWLCIFFVAFQFAKKYLAPERFQRPFRPGHALGMACGMFAGVTSAIGNAAGPVVAVFLLPQKLPKEIYTGTTVLVFTWINLIKLILFLRTGLITGETWHNSLFFLPLIPLGVWLGVGLNRWIPERQFVGWIYGLILASGIYLIIR